MISADIQARLAGLIAGAIPLGYGAWQIRREFVPRRWAQVTGRILTSTIKSSQTPRGEVAVPEIEYEFTFDNKLIKSSQRRISNYVSGSRPDAEAIVARYPVDREVTVFVHPRNPGKSVLEYGVSPLSWIPLALGLVFMSVALFVR